jgi:hypothetical protein
MLLLNIGVSMTATGRVAGSEWFRMSDEGLLGCPLYRRRWLLLKALETRSLREALPIAQAAEEFISSPSAPKLDLLPLSAWVSKSSH